MHAFCGHFGSLYFMMEYGCYEWYNRNVKDVDNSEFGALDGPWITAPGWDYGAILFFWKTGVLSPVWVQGSYFESDIYDDERNRETVRAFDREFTYE